jgi:1-acyl-sn-glycerol-3-phosphate acyltransferase
MAKKSIFDHKIAGPLMRGMKHIAVDRDNGSSSFVAAMRALRKGELVGIFPEATISTSFEVKEMKTGAVRLAMGAGVPVIPTAVWGSQRIMTKGRKPNFKPARTPILVAFGQPIYFSKDEDVAAADERLRQEVISLVEKIRQHYPDSPKGQWWAPQSQGGTAPALKP